MPKKILSIACSAVPSILILLVRPLGLTLPQAIILSAMSLIIIWWVTGLVDRTISAIILLAVFCLSGQAPLVKVFSFPLSENFWLIVFSFLFSQGIANSGLADKLLLPILSRRVNNVGRLLVSMLLLIFAMIFIIPQPFSRVIIISIIYSRYFDKLKLDAELKAILMFGIYAFSISMNMLFIRGDIILNNALLAIGGIDMSEAVWMKYMTVPSLVYTLLGTGLFYLVFRKQLHRFPTVVIHEDTKAAPLSKREKVTIVFLGLVILAWALEDVHGISGTIIVIVGTALMIPFGLLQVPKDLKSVNVKLLIFLTAAFSIGGVMKASGTAAVLFQPFTTLFESQFSLRYAVLVLLSAMTLHMILGSNVTTLSVVVPALFTVAAIAQIEVLIFLIYIAVCAHYLLPFHSVIMLLGEGNGYYSGKQIIRYGLPATVLIILSALTLYLGWWKLLGIL